MIPRYKPESCSGCACQSHGTDFSAIEGTGSSGIMFVGEASGEQEAREQLPFRPFAPAGSVLERIIRRLGLDRQQFSTTNVLRCRPRNNWLDRAPWEFSALNQCRTNLESAISERKPRCIVALGGIALRELTGYSGEKQGISHLAGYVVPSNSRTFINAELEPIPVIGDFHPSFLRRGKSSHQGYFSRILKRALNISKGLDRDWMWNIDPEDPNVQQSLGFHTKPTTAFLSEYTSYVLANPRLVLSYDLETEESTSLDEDAREGFTDTHIRLVQFTVRGLGSVAVPWESEFLRYIKALLHSPNTKCGHNVWIFDNRVLRAVGEREGLDLKPRGIIHDTLQEFHHLQPDLPAHLQFASSFVSFPFPWKHLSSSNLEFYGCCDVEATLRLHEMLEATLVRDRLWGDATIGYMGQVYAVRPILDKMQDRGMPIDDEARLRLDEDFDKAQTELLQSIQAVAPQQCCRVHPKQGYKGVPPEIKTLVCGTLDQPWETVAQVRFKEPGEDPEWYHYEKREFPNVSGSLETSWLSRWCRVYDFNPNSQPQVIAYMNAKGHKVPKSREEDEDGNRKDTTGEKELRSLAASTGDEFYIKVADYRGFSKLRGTYIDGFRPGSDGCVHSTFNFDTAIAQLTSKNPNSQNFPKLKPTPVLAGKLRGMVKAHPGKILVEWDYKSFHVLTLGFLAEDPVWMRLARLDMHSFVAGHVLGLWDGPTILKESDEELMARFKWLKSDPERKRVRDDQAKHGILGIGNGLSAKGLFERYMENFPPQSCKGCNATGRVAGLRSGGTRKCPECNGSGHISGLRVAQTFLSALQHLASRIFAYQRNERKNAHEAGDRGYYTPFGFARRFYEVYVFNKKWTPGEEPPRGDQAEQAVSYRHTNVAHCHLREVMKELDLRELDEKYGLYNQIHDALQFHFREDLFEEHVREMYPIMLAPSKILKNAICPNGLSVDVECSKGYVWNAMETVNLSKFKEVVCH